MCPLVMPPSLDRWLEGASRSPPEEAPIPFSIPMSSKQSIPGRAVASRCTIYPAQEAVQDLTW